jgi:hypothetical protein
LRQIDVVGVVTQIDSAATFCVSDSTRMPIQVHGCCVGVNIGDCVLLRNYTIIWGENNVAYLRDIGGVGRVDVLDVHQDGFGYEHGTIKDVDAEKLRKIQRSVWTVIS